MSESQTDVKTEANPTEGVDNQIVGQDVKTSDVPYARFKEVNDKLKSFQAEKDKLATEVNSMKEAKLIEEGKKDDVIANLKSELANIKKDNDVLSNYVVDERDRLLSNIPEEKREVYENVDLVALRDIVQERQELLNKKVGVDNSRGGTSMNPPKDFHEMTPEEKNDPAVWTAYLNKFRRK